MSSLPSVSRRLLGLLVCAALLALVPAGLAQAQTPAATASDAPAGQQAPDASTSTGDVVVDILPLEGFLDPPVAGAIVDLIHSAEARNAALVVLQIDTPGAVSADLDTLLTAVRESTVPVVVYVGPRGAHARAGGAGALLGLSADVLAMADDATLGPAVPADLGQDPGAAHEADRLQGLLGSDAGGLTDRLLDADASDGVSPQALQQAGVDVVAANGLESLLVELDGRTVSTAAGPVTLRIRSDEIVPRLHSLGLVRRMLHAATTPVFIYLLLTIGLALLLFEVFQPGFGVAGIAGLITAGVGAFGLTVLPVHWWAVALLVAGLLLYAVDVAIAGFGVVTVAATAAFVTGSIWLYDSPWLGVPGWLIAAMTVAALVFFVGVMTAVLRAQAGPDEVAVGDLVGKVGMVRSVLNPQGHVYIDGALWRARWIGQERRAKVGTPVVVTGVEGPLVLVERFDKDTVAEARTSPSGAGTATEDA